jgi:hypothetical protein
MIPNFPSQTSTATVTVEPPTQNRCQTRYRASGNGKGNTVKSLQGVEDCCEQCFATPNCVASAQIGQGTCQLLVKVVALGGAQTNEQCLLGVEDYFGGFMPDPNGAVFAGPCGN